MNTHQLIRIYRSKGLLESSFIFERISSGLYLKPTHTPKFYKSANNRYENIIQLQYIYDKNLTPFSKHFICSIPYIYEEFLRIGQAISIISNKEKVQKITFWETDSPDGSNAKSMCESSTSPIYSLTNGIHKINKKNFYKTLSHKKSFYFEGLVWDITKESLTKKCYHHHFNTEFDFILENLTFQFYGKHRISQIAFLKKFLSKNGILISIEKIKHNNTKEFQHREDQKDYDFKSKFFTKQEIKDKRDNVLTDMSYMVTLERLIKSLKYHFRYVAISWNSGNFYSFISSNNEQKFKEFLLELGSPIIPNEYCYHDNIMVAPIIV